MADIYGNSLEQPYSYIMKDGELLIEAPDPRLHGFIKAKWNGIEWEEAATLEDIEAARVEFADNSLFATANIKNKK